MNKECYKCGVKREFAIERCECGETLVENRPNAARLMDAMRNVRSDAKYK